MRVKMTQIRYVSVACVDLTHLFCGYCNGSEEDTADTVVKHSIFWGLYLSHSHGTTIAIAIRIVPCSFLFSL